MACASGACAYPLDLSRFSIQSHAAARPGVRPDVRPRIQRWLLAIFEMHEHWQQRQALAALDDRMLADIGLTRDEVRSEATKPFWT